MPKLRSVHVQNFLRSLQNATPVIAFFLIGFVLVYGIFGMQYVCVVSVVTVFFQTRHKRNDNTPYRYARLLIVGSLLIVFAYISSRSLLLCVLLNLCIPFALVFTQSSQFNPKGYFSYAMIFVFLSLMPPESLQELAVELLVFFLCVALLALSIRLYSRFFLRISGQSFTLENGFNELAEMLLMLPEPASRQTLEKRYRQLVRDFHGISYHQRFFAASGGKNQLYDMFSTLLQRFSYLIVDDTWRDRPDSSYSRVLQDISAFLKDIAPRAGESYWPGDARRAQKLLDGMEVPEGRVRIFCRSLLHMVILMLRTTTEIREKPRIFPKMDVRDFWRQIRLRCSRESFEMRFAMRLSAVMTISCALGFILPVTRSYWIPLNAFLLMQPSYEDSSYRMKTRSIGTLLGCCVEFIVCPFLPGIGGRIAFSLLMISLMYCATPGTWNQPIFSTCYALTMASLTLDETIAITLRIVYLAAAVAIVFVVNRFFFPMRKETQFRYNFKALFRLNNSYWDIIRDGLSKETRLSVSNEILTYFHMIYQECAAYIQKNKSLPFREDREAVLLKLWHMFSELEQMHFLVRTKSILQEERKALIHLIDAIQEELYPIISYENFPVIRGELRYEEPEVVYVLEQYLKHAESLLAYKHCIPF